MIQSKKEYLSFLEADSIALNKKKPNFISQIICLFFPDYIWNFQKLLRRLEFAKNSRKSLFNELYIIFLQFRFKRLSLKLGFSIPPNVFGPGLAIVHYGTIVVNANSRVGANCRIHPCTNIGASGGSLKAPQIGNNVYIGPGAKIYGDIAIANNIAIAANAAVNKSFSEENILIGGVPAKKIKEIDISSLIKHLRKSDL
jgi:serine O-acetyltransferase